MRAAPDSTRGLSAAGTDPAIRITAISQFVGVREDLTVPHAQDVRRVISESRAASAPETVPVVAMEAAMKLEPVAGHVPAETTSREPLADCAPQDISAPSVGEPAPVVRE